MADAALAAMERDFAELHAPIQRPSFPPKQQLRTLLVTVSHSAQSERRLGGIQLQPAVPVVRGLGADEAVRFVTVFIKNRERFIDGEIVRKFLCEMVEQVRTQEAISDEQFAVDGADISTVRELGRFCFTLDTCGPIDIYYI
jgi:transposase